MIDLAALGLSVRSDGVVVATDRLEDFKKSSDNAARGADNTAKSSNALSANLRRLAGIAGTVAGSVAAIFSIGAIARGAAEVQSITNSFLGMGQTASQAAASLDAVARIANSTRAPLASTAELYRRVSVAAGELGASNSDVEAFTKSIGQALAAAGTSPEQASGALLQLSQAMAGGTVRAEEFNSILEGAFPIAQAAARGIDAAGGSVGRLRQLVVEGKVSSQEFFQAILSQSSAIEAAFGRTVPTVAQAMSVLNNSVSLAAAQFDSTIGISAGLATAILAVSEGIAFLSDNVETVTGMIIAAGAAALIQFAPAIYAAVASTYAWVAAMVTLRGALIATGVGALIVAAGLLIGEFLKLVTAAGGFGNAMSLLGDVAGAVWRGMIDSASAIPPALNGVWASMKAGFLDALSSMATKFHDFVWTIANGLNQVPGMEGLGGNLMGVAEAASAASGVLSKAAAEANSEASGSFDRAAATITEAFAPAREAVSRLKDVFKETKVAVDEVGVSAAATGAAMGAMGGAGKSAAEKAKEEVKELDDLATRLGSTFGDLFIAATKGADAFRSALSNVLSNLASMLANAAFTQLFKSAGGGLLGAIGDAVNALIPSANGNVFQGGSLVPFANGGVIGGPTVFPMRGGRTGLMGEAGPEAIMPLRRGRDGRLGVAAQSQQAAPVDVRVFVDQDGNWQAQVERIADRRVRQQAPTLVRQSVQAVYATNEERKLR
jgi:tape measure domain-containing protein